ncbi:hypothetical protein OC25_11945 [Pedobacter kyungheensis]|uniref:Uncharacterized protein n=1 Tax=Pedobacter kyungheensis TaxID=1069985 RepID=A0A0C1G0Y7_9SPHI|nr:hypothetical protein OC25_11945 [Pedobacter kyungheensis]
MYSLNKSGFGCAAIPFGLFRPPVPKPDSSEHGVQRSKADGGAADAMENRLSLSKRFTAF